MIRSLLCLPVLLALAGAGSRAAAQRQLPVGAAPGPVATTLHFPRPSQPRVGATLGDVSVPGGDGWNAGGVLGVLRTPAGAFGASLVLPGSGQAALGLRRWALYGLAEVGFWAMRLDAVHEEARFSQAYRDLAWAVARSPGSAPREDGSWGYYEAMSHYASSGAYDYDPSAPGVQPERDPATYNGSIWALALSLYAAGGSADPAAPGYDRAVAYYQEKAVGEAFLWSWVGHESDLDRFRGLIRRSDDEARRATLGAGLVLANHLVSAVDALIAARLRASGMELDNRIEPVGAGMRWRLGLRIPLRQDP